MINPMGAIR